MARKELPIVLIEVIILKYIVIFFIRVYQLAISPLLGANCRFTPTCSQYGIEAVKEWGPFKGSWMTIKRISRCHPWGGSGHDPVPKKISDEPKR